MIYSMTAFARLEIKKDWGDAVWEIRSVNQRYLENFFRLPEQFRGLENALREKLRQNLTRGKIECSLRIDSKKQAAAELNLNKELANQVIQSLQWIKAQAGEGEINLADVLRYPGVVEAAAAKCTTSQVNWPCRYFSASTPATSTKSYWFNEINVAMIFPIQGFEFAHAFVRLILLIPRRKQ